MERMAKSLAQKSDVELQEMISVGTKLIYEACDIAVMTRGELREAVKVAKLIGRCYAEKLRRESGQSGKAVRT